MCDTLVVLANATKTQKMLFAKNSDRDPNEVQIIERIPAKNHNISLNPLVQTTYIKVKQVEHTYAVTLFKPEWIWGAEMGFNEYGVNIGNEAVFTKAINKKQALIGMDLLRLALERSKTAIEALYCITNLLQTYNQGGNCGYQKKFFYDNSFLIADGKDAYVLETAGKYWAAIKVKDFYVISNSLTIENYFDLAHPDIIAEKKRNPKFSFAKKFREPIYTYFSQAKKRRHHALSILADNHGNITVETLMEILRSHNAKTNKASVSSICMHAGGLIGDHTTGSYIVEYNDKHNIYYVTGASLPCLSIYKPILQTPISKDCTNKGIEYWLKRERLTRYFLSGQADKTSFIVERNNLEKAMLEALSDNNSKIEDAIIDITLKEEKLINKYLQPLINTQHKFSLGRKYYRKYWAKQTNKLFGGEKNV